MNGFILCVVESPFAGDVAGNLAYLERCLRDCIDRGESPYASHKMLTTCLDDEKPEERKLGIEAGLAWRRRADLRVFYTDRGWSRGMLAAREMYDRDGLVYQVRSLMYPERVD